MLMYIYPILSILILIRPRHRSYLPWWTGKIKSVTISQDDRLYEDIRLPPLSQLMPRRRLTDGW